MLIDTHAHLTDERYGGAAEIISAMPKDNLEKIVCVSYDMESSRQSVKIAGQNKDIYCAVGVHPCDSQKLDGDIAGELTALAKNKKVVAIGEIGLDYHFEDTDRQKQKYWLERQLEIAETVKLPVIFHVRDSYEDMLEIVKTHYKKLSGGVMHCFSGSLETAKQYVDMGFYISFSGSVTFKNAKKFPDIIRVVPADKILVETDCPYLTPEPHRGELNMPAYVAFTLRKVAAERGISEEEAQNLTSENAYRLFTRMKKDIII